MGFGLSGWHLLKWCGENLMAETEAQKQKPKTSILAILSVVLGSLSIVHILSVFIYFYFPIMVVFLSIPVGLVLGTIAHIRITMSNGMLKGIRYAIVGIVFNILGFVWIGFLFWSFSF